VRLGVGIEDVSDLIADLRQALDETFGLGVVEGEARSEIHSLQATPA